MSAATREGLRRLDGWTVALWLKAPHGPEGPGRWHVQRVEKLAYHDVGPMRGIVRLDADPDAASFLFARLAGGVVRLQFAQISTWAEISPPPRPPLPVEELTR
jgi:hypothetical protein